MNTIIVEAGSSKSTWNQLTKDELVNEFTLGGINPTTQSKSNILSVIEIAKQNIYPIPVDSIYFYGAGCKGIATTLMFEILQYCFPSTKINIFSDLLAAARSSCNGTEGIVSILGTGSHSCLSDGHKIIHEKPALGYLLGDEGSGNYYGKQILSAYFYNLLNKELIEKLETEFPFIRDEYLSSLYSSPRVSFELAQFFPFLLKNKSDSFIADILQQGILVFYKNRIAHYKDKLDLPIHIVGNVGNQLKEEYIYFLKQKGFNQIFFNPNPIEGLIKYHNQYVRN